jgi:hypothetical protein
MKRKPLNPMLPSPYNRMPARELDADVAKFDGEMTGLPGKPLSSAQKQQHRRAAKMGRPISGKGAKRITITMEGGLLGKVDSYARRKKMTRSATIAYGIKALLKAG